MGGQDVQAEVRVDRMCKPGYGWTGFAGLGVGGKVLQAEVWVDRMCKLRYGWTGFASLDMGGQGCAS